MRKLFNDYGLDALPKNVPRDMVRLNTNYFDIDINTSSNQNNGEFLEGLDIPCEEFFEDWLRTQRSFFNCSEDKTMYERTQACTNESAAISASICSPRIRIAISSSIELENPSNYTLQISQSEDILYRIVSLLIQNGGIDIYDYNVRSQLSNVTRSNSTQPPHAHLILVLTTVAEGLKLTIQLKSSQTEKIICCRQFLFNEFFRSNQQDTKQKIEEFVVESVDEILFVLTRPNDKDFIDANFAAKLVHTAIENLFKVTPEGLDIARTNLDYAIELDNDAVFYAWRAYTMTHYLDDPRISDFEELKDEAIFYARKAHELDPFNPLLLSLLTHVYSFGLKQFDKATECMDKAMALGSDHLMTYDAQALLNLYMGKLSEAKIPAIRASNLSRFLPFRHCFMTTLCMINGLEGNFQSAIKAGELALRQQDNDLSCAYPPTVRYLAANYKMAGEFEKAFRLIESLNKRKRIHPGTSVRHTEHIIPNLEIARFVNS